MQKEDTTWYASWFNSPYYHILYKDRDASEAAGFMRRLTSHLSLTKHATILDLACGKGRHSRYLATLGYNITGVDLSIESIKHARQFEKQNLNFVVHDMCLPFEENKFDAVFNLFTSFGYFEKEEDNLRTIKAIKKNLKQGGLAVIDFFNVHHVLSNLVEEEIKVVDNIEFHISKKLIQGYIHKNIKFTIDGNDLTFTEKVKALELSDFHDYLNEAGLQLKQTFGDYQLHTFNKQTSERLILIFGV